MLFLKGISYTV